jgi:hypothetical protein
MRRGKRVQLTEELVWGELVELDIAETFYPHLIFRG